LVCSSCGYENPREHRYCGMCGTPFPHRPLTVPEAQSTLSFSSTPLEVPPAPLAVQHEEPAAPVEMAVEQVVAEAHIATPEVAAVSVESAAGLEVEHSAEVKAAPVVAVEVEAAAESVAVEKVPPAEEATPIPLAESAVAEAPQASEAAIAERAVEVKPVEGVAPVETPPPTPPMVEPALVELSPRVEPPPAVSVAGEPAPAARVTTEVQAPPPPEVRRPAPHIVARPVPPLREVPAARTDVAAQKPVAPHPSPDSLRITPPPESAGMPTFQSVVEAAGAPPISPFEPPKEKHADEDRELQEFVAGFRYTPPEETADELTMRSEVPVIDREEPAEFHHASFDDDVPPPPEAGAHPRGEEYYPGAHASIERPRSLEVSEPEGPAEAREPARAPSVSSFLGLDEAAPAPPAFEEVAPARRSHTVVWSVVAALAVIFGGLGFLEGRAQITRAFRGPVEIVRDQFASIRLRMAELSAKAPAAQPAAPAPEAEKQAKPAETAAGDQPTTPAVPVNGARNEQSAPASVGPGAPDTLASENVVAPVRPATTNDAGKSASAAQEATPLEAPPPKPASKPEPGQQELARALTASDPAAAAAWLWKATSRGNPEAPVRLADLYIKGKGVPRSCEQALVLLRAAATKENAPARNRLAALYANGSCVVRDRVKAYQLLTSALEVDPSSDWAKESRQELWKQMSPQERSEAQKNP